jgi:GR25 family glycosyltransferase involved in LPS biosynthesis
MGIEHVERFDAIAHDNGAVGCGLSHVACLRRALETSNGCVMICEDDVEFDLDRARLDALVDAFLDDRRAEALCLAYFASRSQPHDRLFRRGHAIRTTACYLVRDAVAAELAALWDRGVAGLEQGEHERPIDKLWFPLHDRHVFLVPIVRAARQASGWSDVTGRAVSYAH